VSLAALGLDPESTVWTYEDAVERLLDSFQYNKTGRQYRLAREAVINSYRDISTEHIWKYYTRRHIFESSAEYITGTIAYDVTGGANERQVTLTGGTWPSDAAFGVLQIGTDNWPIATRVSDTVLTLFLNRAPTADIAASTSYTWFRDVYPWPVLTRKMGELIDPADYRVLAYIDSQRALTMQRNYSGQTTDRPYWWTLRNDDHYLNRLSMILGPPPNTSRTYEFIEHTSGQPLTTEVYSTGTVSNDAAGTTLTFVDSVINSAKHLGCVLRLSSDTANLPTSLRGGLSVDNPFDEQRIISSVTSTTVVEVDSAIAGAHAAVKFTISSPLDIEEGSMLSYFWRKTERAFAELTDKSPEEIQHRIVAELRAFLAAKDADRRSVQVQTGQYAPWGAMGGFAVGGISPLG